MLQFGKRNRETLADALSKIQCSLRDAQEQEQRAYYPAD